MQIESASFTFVVPDSWTYFTDAGRLICQGPGEEELIVSIASVHDEAGEPNAKYLDDLFSNAIGSIEQMLSEPDLETVRPLSKDESCLFTCQLALSRSSDGTVLFSQVAVRAPWAVLFATLETPASVPHTALLAAFVRSLRAAANAS